MPTDQKFLDFVRDTVLIGFMSASDKVKGSVNMALFEAYAIYTTSTFKIEDKDYKKIR